MSGISIETQHLTKEFGSFRALDHLDLKISGAKCVGFLGPNGAGKTTTLKLLTGMIFATEGDALLNGLSVQKERKSALSKVGALIENPEIYPSLTPREALEMVGNLRGMSEAEIRDRTKTVLQEVKISDWIDHKTGRFSKGMKQRVNIAASLLSDPEILLLDEPSTGLDPRGMAEVRSIIRGLKRNNRLIFMSSHILSEVVDVCDEVALLNRGKLLFYDTLEAVKTRFSEGASPIEVIFTKPVDDDIVNNQIARIQGVVKCERLDPNRLMLSIKGDGELQAGMLEELVGMHLGVSSFHEARNSLEEIYMSQIERGD
jgi:ABC-2 type transport system ATP-binding protein